MNYNSFLHKEKTFTHLSYDILKLNGSEDLSHISVALHVFVNVEVQIFECYYCMLTEFETI